MSSDREAGARAAIAWSSSVDIREPGCSAQAPWAVSRHERAPATIAAARTSGTFRPARGQAFGHDRLEQLLPPATPLDHGGSDRRFGAQHDEQRARPIGVRLLLGDPFVEGAAQGDPDGLGLGPLAQGVGDVLTGLDQTRQDELVLAGEVAEEGPP